MTAPVSAGDVGRFAYCALNWKLSLAGQRGTGGKEGVRGHEAAAAEVDALEMYRAKANVTLQSSFYLALFAISAAALGVEFFYLERATTSWWFLVTLSVLWMGASLYLFVFNRYYASRERSAAGRRITGDARVLAKDQEGGVRKALKSSRLPLQGTPDYVLERDGLPVPVELKTGKTPRQPYDSHVMQLAAYCYLVQEAYQRRPAVGIVAYPDRQFEVAYTADLEDRLLRTLLRIELATRTGEAHRDHENPKRCAGCSRRDACNERLA